MTRIPLILSLLAPFCLLTPLAAGQDYHRYSWQQYSGTGHWYAVSLNKEFPENHFIVASFLGGYAASFHDFTERRFVFDLGRTKVPYYDEYLYAGAYFDLNANEWAWQSEEIFTENVIYGTGSASEFATLNGHGYEGSLSAISGGSLGYGVYELEFNPVLDSDGGGVPDAYEDQNHDGNLDAWETDVLNPSDDSFAFYVRNLTPGHKLHVRLHQGTPGATVIPICSKVGIGSTDIGYGIYSDLAAPIVQGAAFALNSDGNGESNSTRVPGTIPMGTMLWFQGVEISFNGQLNIRTTRAFPLAVGAN